MRIVRIFEGLGNQMFQQALLISLRKSSGEPVFADISDYKRISRHNGYELERVFGIKNIIATNKEILRYTYRCNNPIIQKIYRKLSFFRYGDIKERYFERYIPNLVQKHRHGYYDGYWQCYEYFKPFKEEIISNFQFKNPLVGKNKEIASEIMAESYSVSIHVRRGDYLMSWRYNGLCGIDYYQKAIDHIKELINKPICFYVFSNDIDWCKLNLTPLLKDSKCKFVDWNTEWILTSTCN